MGSTESVPQAYEFTGIDGPWFSIARLSVDVGAGVVPGRGRRSPRAGHRATRNADGLTAAPVELRNRRLPLRGATVEVTVEQMNRALAALPLPDVGVSEARVWMAPDGPRLAGTFSVGNRRAPFTVRPMVVARADGHRRLRVGLSDVRVYGALPFPAPLIGVALAGAIGAAFPGAGPHIRTVGPHLEVDLLALALEQSLVARGWRVPDLQPGWLEAIEPVTQGLGGGAWRLKFRGDAPAPARAGGGEPSEPFIAAGAGAGADDGGVPSASATVEGEPIPEVARGAEEKLNAGDLVAAEQAIRLVLRESPDSRPVQARLLALRAAADGADVADLADDMNVRWPEFVPAWLYTAIAAREAGDAERAADAFGRAATLCEQRDEREDAGLARAAEAEARAAAAQLRGTTTAHLETGAAPEITAQDPPPDSAGAEAAEITLQDQPLEEPETTAEAEPDLTPEDEDEDEAPPVAEPRVGGEPVPEGSATADAGADGVTEETEAIYAEKDPDARTAALGQLLDGFETRPLEQRHRAYISFGRVAEACGDLEHAEEAYWRATRLAGDPRRRADDLLAHARVLISRGNVAAAIAELEEARAMVPDHAGSLALLADQAFQARHWERARHYYSLLERAPEAAEVIARALLLDRRAVLARGAGDLDEAEACYRELAVLTPRQLEPRRALAELAMARDDLRTAAARWEEVLRLLPPNALDALLDVRQRLTDLYVSLGDWSSARVYAELVLAHDPGRVALLERMVEIDEHLGLYPAAVDVLGRLARLYRQPRQRAQALFRQGQLLLERLNDPARAFDAHLKASDLDPTYTPTALRLIEGYWRSGDFREAAAVGEELRRTGPLGHVDVPPLLRARWALALVLDGRAEAQALNDSGLDAEPWDPEAAATALSEAAAILRSRAPRDLEPATAVLEAWSLQGPTAGVTAEGMQAALRAKIAHDPAAPGVARSLGWLADREGDALTARVFYAAAAFIEEGGGTAGRLDELGLAPASPPRALALLGPADHPDSSGSAAPLRRTLAALAHALAGFDGTLAPRTDEAPRALSGAQLAIEVQEDYAALARALDAPPVVLIPAADHREGSGTAVRVVVPPGGLRVVAGRPATIEIPAGLVGIPHDELTFLVARALDHLRSGLALAAQASEATADEVGHLLQGAWSALTGTPPDGPALARSVAEALGDPQRREALLRGGDVTRTVEDLEHARALAAAWETFRGGAERAGDRFAALACRNPLAAFRALYRASKATPPGITDLPERERRIGFLHSGRVRDLLAFLGSPEYARALGVTGSDGAT